MSETYHGIDSALRSFIEAQHLFFVATAPLDATGHVNVSPKGLDTFRVLDRLLPQAADPRMGGAKGRAGTGGLPEKEQRHEH